MTHDLESRLRSQLQAEAELLPAAEMTVGSVVGRGRQRRRRAGLVTGAGCLVALVGAVTLALPAIQALNQRAETVSADQPETSELTDVTVREVLEVEDPDHRSMAQALTELPPEAVLFHTDHEGCGDLADQRNHPDWQQGQFSDETLSDGTPTYGFAYNTGDLTAGDIDWQFAERDFARSGNCVVAMTLNNADTEAPAVRLVRRYDDQGRELPADAFYSIWMYFPEEIEVDDEGIRDGELVFGFWSIFQFKNHVDMGDGVPESLSTFSFNTGRLPGDDFMALTAYRKAVCGEVEECAEADNIEQESPVAIPLEKWVHFEVQMQSRPDESGRMVVWQDGQKIIDFQGQTERPNTVQRTWSIKSMGQLHDTASHTLYADDPLISTEPIHPKLFG